MRIKPGRTGQQRKRRLERRVEIRAEAEKKRLERESPNDLLSKKIVAAFAFNSIEIEDDPNIAMMESRGSGLVDFSAITVRGSVLSMLVNSRIDHIEYHMTHDSHPAREWYDKNTSDFFAFVDEIDESQCLEYVDETARMVGLICAEVSLMVASNPNGFYRIVSKNNGEAIMLVVVTGEAVDVFGRALEIIKMHMESKSSPCDHCCRRDCEPCASAQDNKGIDP